MILNIRMDQQIIVKNRILDFNNTSVIFVVIIMY